MKLLLTSEGFSNDSIKNAFYDMLDKSVTETSIVFVTTSANGVGGDKKWLISLTNQLVEMNFKEIGILDFSGIPESMWLSRLEGSDVIFFSGDDSVFLMNEIIRTGLKGRLSELLKTRIYVGNSAGSIVACKSLVFSNPKHRSAAGERGENTRPDSLGYTDFHIRPHYNSFGHPSSKKAVQTVIDEIEVTEKVYLIDVNLAAIDFTLQHTMK